MLRDTVCAAAARPTLAPDARAAGAPKPSAITELAPHEGRLDELAAWIREYWQIENSLHRSAM